MDPISLTCTVISLATALKDLVALGVRLKKFCDGVSKNHKELARLCQWIPSDLEELERLYQLNVDAMDQSPSLKVAVEKLIGQLDVIASKFELLSQSQPNAGARVLVKLKAAFKASDVEDDIQHLKEDISTCYQSFQLIAITRIEMKLQEVSSASQDVPSDLAQVMATTEKTHQAVQQLLALTTNQRVEVQRMKSNVQHQLQGDDGSSEISQTPTAVVQSSHSNTLAFINDQLSNVGVEVSRRKVDANLHLDSLQRPTRPFKQHIPVLSYHRSPEKRHRTLLQKVLVLLESLEDDATAVDEHGYSLNTLGDYFVSLRMFHEAKTVYTWAVDLYRILSAFQPQEFAPFLAETLTSLAWVLDEVKADPSAAINEAIGVLRPLCNVESAPDVQCQFANQLAMKHRFEQSRGSQDDMLQDFDAAIAMFDSIFREDPRFKELSSFLEDIDHLSSQPSSILSLFSPSVSTKTSDFELIGFDAYLLRQAFVLEVMSEAHLRSYMVQAAETCVLRAAIMDSYLASQYPDTDLEVLLARRLTYIPYAISPAERKLGYMDQSLRLTRKAYSFDPKLYADDLFFCLASRARFLMSLGKRVEAHQHWLEVFQIDLRTIEDPLALAQAYDTAADNLCFLERDEEVTEMRIRSVEALKTTFGRDSVEEAATLHKLARDYARAGRCDDALRTVATVVHQLETLLDHGTVASHQDYEQDLADSLSLWLKLLPHAWSDGLSVDHEAIKTAITHFNLLIRRSIKFLDQYMSAIAALTSALPDCNIAIQVNMEIITQLQELASNHHDCVTPRLQERWIEHGRLVSLLNVPRM